MATQIQYPIINGVRFDWSSFGIRFKTPSGVDTVDVLGVKDLTYGDGLDPGQVMGTRAVQIARTRGKYSKEASIELYKLEADALFKRLGDGFGEKPFDIIVSFNETGQPVITDVIEGARIKKPAQSGSGSDGGATVKIDLDPHRIKWSGIYLTNK